MKLLISGKVFRFGLLEFALITCTWPKTNWVYLNGDVALKLTDLENAFLSCENVEDGWKLDLSYLVEGLLLADEPTSKVNLDFLSFVEDEEFFFFFNILWVWTHITILRLVLINIWYIKKKKTIWSTKERIRKAHRLSTLYMDIFLHYSIRHMRW